MDLNEKHYELFVRTCKRYIKIFGLYTWKVKYMFSGEQPEGNLAECWTHYEGRVATLILNKKLPDHYSKFKDLDRDIERAAFHEVMELVLSPLGDQARARDFVESEYVREVHSIIRMFEHVFVPPYSDIEEEQNKGCCKDKKTKYNKDGAGFNKEAWRKDAVSSLFSKEQDEEENGTEREC